MAVNTKWVGDIPSMPISMRVNDSFGRPMNLSLYNISVTMLDPDDEEVNLDGSALLTGGASSGRIVFRWPTDRSLLTKSGDYVMQIQLHGTSGTRDSTTTHTVRVRRTGGNN